MPEEVHDVFARTAYRREFQGVAMARDRYAHLAQRFVEHYASLRGALRYELITRQLDDHLPQPPQRVIDVGGGVGHQAIRLARVGCEVTLVDPSTEMLTRARAAISSEPSEVAARLRLVKATAARIPEVLSVEPYDVVLCHGVLPYVENAKEVIGALGQMTRAGGYLSLVFKNADALAMRPALEGRWVDAEAAFDAAEDVGGMGEPTRAHHRDDVETWLTTVGYELTAWYGLRVMSDHLTDHPASDLAEVLPVEVEASRRDPYRALGRLIHVVATCR